ncbi:MAG: hypothetical protein ACKN9T_12380 [Candidatus Methylumidiphilus sp.]
MSAPSKSSNRPTSGGTRITYRTNKDVVFDYLRGLHFAIVDEAESILVDEARTPLIISGQPGAAGDEDLFRQAMAQADGTRWGVLPSANRPDMLVQALSALYLYQRDKHYLVREGAAQIVDEFTGRVMPDRSWRWACTN